MPSPTGSFQDKCRAADPCQIQNVSSIYNFPQELSVTIGISDWQPLDDGWTCILCTDGRKHTIAHTLKHEKSAFHQTLVEEAARREHEDLTTQVASNEEHHSTALPSALALVDSATVICSYRLLDHTPRRLTAIQIILSTPLPKQNQPQLKAGVCLRLTTIPIWPCHWSNRA